VTGPGDKTGPGVTPMAYYYIIDGRVRQAPDLGSVLNTRMTHVLLNMHESFKTTFDSMRYNSATKKYCWDFRKPGLGLTAKPKDGSADENEEKLKSDSSAAKITWFQRNRVDHLLDDLTKRFPISDESGSPRKDTKLMVPPRSVAESSSSRSESRASGQIPPQIRPAATTAESAPVLKGKRSAKN